MAEWESYYEQLIKPIDLLKKEKIDALRKKAWQRANEISDILVGLSKYKLEETYFEFGEIEYRPTFKNIKTNEDVVREEFRGAIQRYLLGMDEDALLHACFALEAGLLVKDDEKLNKKELKRKDTRFPLTLGKNIRLWLPKSEDNKYGKGFIKDKGIIERLERIGLTRNSHVHGFNFIAATVLRLKKGLAIYESIFDFLNLIKIDFEKTENEEMLKNINEAKKIFPSDLITPIEQALCPEFIRMVLSDITSATKSIRTLSDFRWCANKKCLKLTKERFQKYELDFFHFATKETLYDVYTVLKHVSIL